MAERPDRYPWLDLLEVDGPFLSRPALDDVYDQAWPPRSATSSGRSSICRQRFPPSGTPRPWPRLTGFSPMYSATGRVGRSSSIQARSSIRYNAAVSPHAAGFSRRDENKPRLVVLGWARSRRDARRRSIRRRSPPTRLALDPDTASGTRRPWAWRRAGARHQRLPAPHGLGRLRHYRIRLGHPTLYRLAQRLATLSSPCSPPRASPPTRTPRPPTCSRLSQDKQVDVTEKLGVQVRRAAEALVNAVSRANRNTDGKLLAGIAPKEVLRRRRHCAHADRLSPQRRGARPHQQRRPLGPRLRGLRAARPAR